MNDTSRSATDRHHLYWPRRDYKTPTEKHFRNLPCHIIRILVSEHRHIHATTGPPTKPSHEEMAEMVNRHRQGFCPCQPVLPFEEHCPLCGNPLPCERHEGTPKGVNNATANPDQEGAA